MVIAGRWQKVLRSSTKDKVLRPGRYSFSKGRFEVTYMPKESFNLRLSQSGPVVKIAQENSAGC